MQIIFMLLELEFHQLFCVKFSQLNKAQLVERRSLTGELSLSCARPAADG